MGGSQDREDPTTVPPCSSALSWKFGVQVRTSRNRGELWNFVDPGSFLKNRFLAFAQLKDRALGFTAV